MRRAHAPRLLRTATDRLAERHPQYSARTGLTAGQKYGIAVLFAAVVLSLALAPFTTLRVLAAVGTLFFGLVVSLRVVACIYLIVAAPARLFRRKPPRIADDELPVYTLLVPLYREANMLPGLVEALNRIDYPASRLDIKLILEESDPGTLAAALRLQLPPRYDIVVVPDAEPRTKPKALNYALQLARGDFAVIYDAEDAPEPGQLRAAIAAFRAGPPNLACVQARLAIYNARENFLTRQFAIEYAALFDGLLPALERLRLPIPLGGTSNHFRMPALRWLGAWDAYNVTEDADIGMRLARSGYTCRMLDSVTLEEAVIGFRPWLRQRTRWLKGFMQTYFVHMRRPFRLWRQLGTAGFLGFQIVIGGMIFSALAHPVFYALVAMEAASAGLLGRPETLLGLHIWLLALFNVALGYTASMALALIALKLRGLALAP
ncbi:MAG: glycosyltransferase family 2 protein, partial [Hyphomicrobiales bacterium]